MGNDEEPEVGAVLCFDASRLARNGRDWHHLLELCSLVEARDIDLDGVYDPCRPNDRLLLGMKGSISEFELGVLRARMFEAARAKAHRGELRISVPIGCVWHRKIGLGFDPDIRLQETIRLIFERFRKLGSARQMMLSLATEEVHFPRPSDGKKMVSFDWSIAKALKTMIKRSSAIEPAIGHMKVDGDWFATRSRVPRAMLFSRHVRRWAKPAPDPGRAAALLRSFFGQPMRILSQC